MKKYRTLSVLILALLIIGSFSACVASASNNIYFNEEKYVTPTPPKPNDSPRTEKTFVANIDVYVGFFFNTRFSMATYKIGQVGPINGGVDKKRFDQEIDTQYSQVAKEHSTAEFALFPCQSEIDCPTNDSGTWGTTAGFHDGAEEEMLKGLSSLEGKELTTLNLSRQRFLFVYHNGSRQTGIELRTEKGAKNTQMAVQGVGGGYSAVSEMLIQFADGYSIPIGELLQKLSINPDTQMDLMNGVGTYQLNK